MQMKIDRFITQRKKYTGVTISAQIALLCRIGMVSDTDGKVIGDIGGVVSLSSSSPSTTDVVPSHLLASDESFTQSMSRDGANVFITIFLKSTIKPYT